MEVMAMAAMTRAQAPASQLDTFAVGDGALERSFEPHPTQATTATVIPTLVLMASLTTREDDVPGDIGRISADPHGALGGQYQSGSTRAAGMSRRVWRTRHTSILLSCST